MTRNMKKIGFSFREVPKLLRFASAHAVVIS
jgi:hypothetical protein